MSNTKIVRIHHFDDEPNNISALRDNLLYLVMATKPMWIKPEEIPDDDDDVSRPFLIKIHHQRQGLVIIDYRIYASADDFYKVTDLGSEDIVILDAYERCRQQFLPESRLAFVGSRE